MPRASVGYGANFGDNFGGGGIIRLSGLNPAPFGTITANSTFHASVGVAGALISLATVTVIVGGETAFSNGSFQGTFVSSSTYQYNPSLNGYDFKFVKTGGYVVSPVQVTVLAETRDGATTTQTYQLFAELPVTYPPIPFNQPLGYVSLEKFSGEAGGPLLGQAQGLAFFSPALTSRANSQIDVQDFEVKTDASDKYAAPPGSNNRPWLWGPPPAVPPVNPPVFPPVYSSQYEPHFNRGFCFLKTTQRSVYGVMTDTMTSDTTVILY